MALLFDTEFQSDKLFSFGIRKNIRPGRNFIDCL